MVFFLIVKYIKTEKREKIINIYYMENNYCLKLIEKNIIEIIGKKIEKKRSINIHF